MTYEQFAKDLARKAGAIIKKSFSLGMKKEWKEDFSPVTATDKEINKVVIDEVAKYFPDHNVKGEEESNISNDSDYLWVCDPVDGTIPFSHGIPIFSFSLALVKNGESILGVIYDPILDRMFFAEKGKGAYLNDKKINVDKEVENENSVLNIESFGRATYKLFGLPKIAEENNIGYTVRIPSIAYSMALVAAGEIVGSIFPNNTAHDIAAAKVIVEEAGGKVTDLFGNEQRYDQDIKGAIASNGKIHDYLVELVNNALNIK